MLTPFAGLNSILKNLLVATLGVIKFRSRKYCMTKQQKD